MLKYGVEQQSAQWISLLRSSLYTEALAEDICANTCCLVRIQILQKIYVWFRHTLGGKGLPQATVFDRIERFGEIHRGNPEADLVFIRLFTQQAKRVQMVFSGKLVSEACLVCTLMAVQNRL